MLKFSSVSKYLVMFSVAAITGIAQAAPAETSTAPQVYEIDGMHCGACAQNLKKEVCEKLKDQAQSCEVEVGKLTLTPATGKTIDAKTVSDLVSASGDYKVKESKK